MAIPQEILDRINEMEAPLVELNRVATEAIFQQSNAETDLRVGTVLEEVEAAATAWITGSTGIVNDLEVHRGRFPNDTTDVQAREAAIMLLHIAVASDLALLQPLEDADVDALVNVVERDESLGLPSAIEEAAFGEGQLFESLRLGISADDLGEVIGG